MFSLEVFTNIIDITLIYFFIYLFHSQKSYKTLKHIYTYTLTHRYTHMHAYAYICVYTVYGYARVHICTIIYISPAIIERIGPVED